MQSVQAIRPTSRFSGTSMLNGAAVAKFNNGHIVPKELEDIPGCKGWSNGRMVYYDTGMTIQGGQGPVLNGDDAFIRTKAQGLADQYFKGDLNKVLFQSPVTLNDTERELLSFALIQRRGWTW